MELSHSKTNALPCWRMLRLLKVTQWLLVRYRMVTELLLGAKNKREATLRAQQDHNKAMG